jgi:hypothetical protein
MRRRKQIITVLVLSMAMLSPYVLPVISNRVIAQAATIVTGEREFKLKVGESKTLSITGTSQKISWKSSDKSVATVSSKGKVLAVKEGNAKIIATIKGKKYIYTVTVYDSNPYLDKAEFEAVEVYIGEISFVVPKDMELIPDALANADTPANVDTAVLNTEIEDCNIQIYLVKQEWEAGDYKEFKKSMLESRTLEIIQNEYTQWANEGYELYEVSDYKSSDYSSPNGLVCKIEYTLNNTKKISEYFQEFDHYFINMTVTDASNMDMDSIAEFVIDSAMIKSQ